MDIADVADCDAFAASGHATLLDRVAFDGEQPENGFTDLISRTFFRSKPYRPHAELLLEIKDAEIYFPNVVAAGGTLLDTNNGYTNLEHIRQRAEDFPLKKDGARLTIDSALAAVPIEKFNYLAAQPNYSAWLLGEIPRLAAYRKFGGADAKFVLHGDARPFHFDTLAAYGLTRDRLILVDASKKIVARDFRYATHGYFHHIASPATVRFLNGEIAGVPPARTGKKIYISRSRTPARRIRNEAALEDALRRDGFDIVAPEDLNFIEQVAVFRNADIIVAPFGAALANLVYVNPACKVVMITTKFTKEFARVLQLRRMNFYIFNGHQRNWSRYLFPSKRREQHTEYILDIGRLLPAIRDVEAGTIDARDGGVYGGHRALAR